MVVVRQPSERGADGVRGLAQDGRCTSQARNERGTRELDQAKLDAIRL